ncbi:MAG TPA: hypothetical protein P5317_07650 [Myxococcota bacterium]|nr:hypothetical protein [Myxococcota bacterium]HRV17870.1 hypothetical protein [Myxococcota bacterium]
MLCDSCDDGGIVNISVTNSVALGSIDGHTDVDTTTTPPVVGQVLQWNGTNWVPVTLLSAGAPDIQQSFTPTSTTIGAPIPTVNTNGLAPHVFNYTNPFAGASAKLLVTYMFGEMRVRFDNVIQNLAMRGNAWVDAVKVNQGGGISPADYDRRWSVSTLSGGVFETTTATKNHTHIMTLTPGQTVALKIDYDYDVNVAPPAGNNGRILVEPATILVQAWKV